jgi:hypothetical protein
MVFSIFEILESEIFMHENEFYEFESESCGAHPGQS